VLLRVIVTGKKTAHWLVARSFHQSRTPSTTLSQIGTTISFSGPPFGRNDAPFGTPGAGPRFGGPPQAGRFPNDEPGFNGGFRNGPPPFPNGGTPFRDGPPPPFGAPPSDSPFGQGGRGSFWNRGGRGGARGGAPPGRGGFRDRGGKPDSAQLNRLLIERRWSRTSD